MNLSTSIRRGPVTLATGATFILAVILVLFLATPAGAAPGSSLTVEQAVELAIKTNPRLMAARARLEGSE